jgi:hypothetical protein
MNKYTVYDKDGDTVATVESESHTEAAKKYVCNELEDILGSEEIITLYVGLKDDWKRVTVREVKTLQVAASPCNAPEGI